ncbi:MAG: lysophospholipase [Salinivirgaceae bacterium]|nr:lysophospholipase [Salinivirgaceae bacterium]
MTNKSLQWQSSDNLNLYAHVWEPNEQAKAVVTLVHGFGEHCMRYSPYIEYFLKQGIAFVGFDLCGHGQSDGKRGTIKSYEALLNDVELALSKTRELFPDIHHFIYGHSMGGNIAFNYILRRQPKLSGAIITSPWFALSNDPNFLLKGAVSLLKNFFPNFTIDSGLDIKYISTVVEEVEKYRSDPLNHGRISFRLFNDITKSGMYAIVNSKDATIPTLMFHGSADKITSPIASKKAADGNTKLIEHVIWPDKYHELHNEDIRPEIAEKVIGWINSKI